MSDWIDELGEDVAQRKKADGGDEPFQLRGAEIIKDRKNAVWTSLMEVVNRDVEKFRAKFAGRRLVELTTATEQRFRLHKTPFPIVVMDVELSYSGASIDVSYTRTLNHYSPMERSEESVEISLDKNSNLVYRHNGRPLVNMDAVSRFLLEPVFKVE